MSQLIAVPFVVFSLTVPMLEARDASSSGATGLSASFVRQAQEQWVYYDFVDA